MILNHLIVEGEHGIPTFNPHLRQIKEFRKLLERDKGSVGDAQGRKKKRATAELAWIFYMERYDSPYRRYYDEDERSEVVKEAVGLPEDWQMDEDVREARERFRQFEETPSMNLIEAAEDFIHKLKEFLNGINLDARTNSGALIFKPKDYKDSLEALDTAVDRLARAKDKIREEQEHKGETAKGGEVIGYFEANTITD